MNILYLNHFWKSWYTFNLYFPDHSDYWLYFFCFEPRMFIVSYIPNQFSVFLFWDRVLLGSTGWSQTLILPQTARVLGFQVWFTTPPNFVYTRTLGYSKFTQALQLHRNHLKNWFYNLVQDIYFAVSQFIVSLFMSLEMHAS